MRIIYGISSRFIPGSCLRFWGYGECRLRRKTARFLGLYRKAKLPALSLALNCLCLEAATFTWDGGGGDDSMDTSANWDSAPTFNSSNDFVFAGTTRLTPEIDNSNKTMGAITFAAGAGAFTIQDSGDALNLKVNGDITNNSSNTQTIGSASQTSTAVFMDSAGHTIHAVSADITFAGHLDALNRDTTFDADSGRTITLKSWQGFNGTYTKNGEGTLVVQNTSTSYDNLSTIKVANGTLEVASLLGINAAGAGYDLFLGGNDGGATAGELKYTGSTATFDRDFFLDSSGNGGTINVTTSGQTLTFEDNDTFNANSEALAVSGAGNVFIDETADIAVNGITKTGAGTLTLAPDGVDWTTGTLSVSAGVVSLQANNGGAWTNAYDAVSGDVTITAGTLSYGGAFSDEQIADSADIAISGGSYTPAGQTETITDLTISGAAVVTVGWQNTGGVRVQGDLLWNGGDIRLLDQDSGTDTATKSTSEGRIRMIDATGTKTIAYQASATTQAHFEQYGTGTYFDDEGGLQLDNGTNAVTREFNIADSGTLGVGTSEMLLDVAVLSAVGSSLRKTGSGVLELTNTNTNYSGDTIVNAGTLLLGANNILNSASDLQLGGGTFSTGGFDHTLTNLTLTADSVIDMGAGDSVLRFTGSSINLSTYTLSVWNWSGLENSGGGTDQLIFNHSLSDSEVDQIRFYSDSGSTLLYNNGIYLDNLQLGTGEVIPTVLPEASTWFSAFMTLLLCAWRWRVVKRGN